jgi:hypothetical protein
LLLIYNKNRKTEAITTVRASFKYNYFNNILALHLKKVKTIFNNQLIVNILGIANQNQKR